MADSIEPSFMVGSCHRHANGYGYGTRVPTARNNPGPPSVPKYHKYPDFEKPMTGSRSRDLGMTGPRADMRHAVSLAHQTSGDYGKFLYPVPTKISTNTRGRRLDNTHSDAFNTLSSTTNGYSYSQPVALSRPQTTGAPRSEPTVNTTINNNGEGMLSRPQTQNRRINSAQNQTQGTNQSEPVYANTYNNTRSLALHSTSSQQQQSSPTFHKTLNPSLPRNCKSDLLASINAQQRPTERGWSINSNILAHNQSVDWRLGLRHAKRAATPGGGGAGTGHSGSPV